MVTKLKGLQERAVLSLEALRECRQPACTSTASAELAAALRLAMSLPDRTCEPLKSELGRLAFGPLLTPAHLVWGSVLAAFGRAQDSPKCQARAVLTLATNSTYKPWDSGQRAAHAQRKGLADAWE